MDAPWGQMPMNNFVPASGINPAINGSLRAWKWLADIFASRSSIMAIERGDTLNVLTYEFIDKKPNGLTDVWDAEKIAWEVQQVIVSGALTSTLSALIVAAGVLVLSF
jgi:hypothetical protein